MIDFQRSITGVLRGNYGYLLFECVNGAWRVEKDQNLLCVAPNKKEAIKFANEHYAKNKKGNGK